MFSEKFCLMLISIAYFLHDRYSFFYFYFFLYIQQYKPVEQKLDHQWEMIHSQGVTISDKNYNLFNNVKGLPFNFAIKFFIVSTIKSFMRSHHLGVMSVDIIQWGVEIRIFHTRFSRVFKSRSVLLLCNYCTIVFYFVCCMALTLFIYLWGGAKTTQKH